MKTAAIIAEFDQINRERPLTDAEADKLFAAIMQQRRNQRRRFPVGKPKIACDDKPQVGA